MQPKWILLSWPFLLYLRFNYKRKVRDKKTIRWYSLKELTAGSFVELETYQIRIDWKVICWRKAVKESYQKRE